MTYSESHFDFVKMHVLSHLSDHIQYFSHMLKYSQEFEKLAYQAKIKDRLTISNKNDVERQILHTCSHQHAIRMSL